MFINALTKVIEGKNLSFDEARLAMNTIMLGEATPAQIGGFLTALRLKGESIQEITGFAKAMRDRCQILRNAGDIVELVGTGGDGSNTFNISTTASIVVASAGVKVAKHGNRGISSKCGSADCLEALGVNLNISPLENERVLEDVGMCFMYAPLYHQSMRYANPVRQELKIRTVFNILGPLANPANATIQLMGVYSRELVEPLAEVLMNLGVKRGVVVHGADGMDEITACNVTYVCEIKDGKLNSYILDPRELGYEFVPKEELVGGDKGENAEITREILQGRLPNKRIAVVLNAGMALYLAGRATNLEEGCKLAEELITTGLAMEYLERFIKRSHRGSEEQ